MTQLTNFQNKKYDLEERTAIFAENVIETLKRITITPINKRIIEQLVGSSGSIAANYYEATEGESKKDFVHKIGICKKEIKETKLWIRLLAKSNSDHSEDLKVLWKEAQEFLLIFSKIISSSRKNENSKIR